MDPKNEDDFWNTSSVSNSTSNFFEDDDAVLSDAYSDQVFNPTTEENSSLPLEALVSSGNLLSLLNETVTTKYGPRAAEETIRNIFFGYQHNIHEYRTLEDKSSLLECAVRMADGNVIVMVILYLKESLRRNIFLNLLSRHKIAITHYTNHLMAKKKYEEVADLYMATGDTQNMKDVYYLLCKETASLDHLHKKVEQFMHAHSQNLNSKTDIEENLNFLRWQLQEGKHACVSLNEQLSELCKCEWEKNKGDEAILEFKKRFNISDFQFEWTTMDVLVRMQSWKKLVSMFIKPNWLSRKMTLKSVIKPDLFVIHLWKHNPPSEVLEQFLQCLSDTEKSLELAQKFELHSFVINYYFSQRDRLGLLNYKDKLTSQADLLMLSNALQSGDRKWKN